MPTYFHTKNRVGIQKNTGVINYNEEVEKLCENCSISIGRKQQRSHRPPEALNDYVLIDAIGNSTAVNSEIPLHDEIFVQLWFVCYQSWTADFPVMQKLPMQGVSHM